LGNTTIEVPLSCFRHAGINMTAVTIPLELSSDGQLAIGLSSAKLAAFAGAAGCPAPGGYVNLSPNIDTPMMRARVHSVKRTISHNVKRPIAHRKRAR
jgi:hypothetical protein